MSESFSILKTFQKNETAGIDGLTEKFYLKFWPVSAQPLVNYPSFTHYYGERSNSQKQALITYFREKDDDRGVLNIVVKRQRENHIKPIL